MISHLDQIVAKAPSEVVPTELVAVVPEVAETEALVLVVQGVLNLVERSGSTYTDRCFSIAHNYREWGQGDSFLSSGVDEKSRTVSHVGHVDLGQRYHDKLIDDEVGEEKVTKGDLVCQEQRDSSNTPTGDLLLKLRQLGLSAWSIFLPSHHHPCGKTIADDSKVLPVDGDESLLQLLADHLGGEVGHKLAKEQLCWKSLHDKIGHLTSGEAVKDTIETETVLLLLETETAIFERVESVGDSTSISLVHFVAT